MKYLKYARLIVLVALLSTFHTTFAQTMTCDTSTDYLTTAQNAQDSGDYDTAVDAYSCALEADFFNYDLHLARLGSAVLAGNYMSAYGDVFLLNNNAPDAVFAEIDRLSSEGDSLERAKVRAFLAIFAVMPDYDLAMSDAEQILATESNSAFAHVIQAAAYEGMEDFEAALSAFNSATELEADNAQIYGLMAAAQFTTFNIEGMVTNASYAIELDGNIAQLYRLRGFTSMMAGDPAAVIEDANRAIALDPNYFAYYVLRGNALRATGDAEAALADFNRIIELNPHTGFGFALRAAILTDMGDTAAAAADIATAIEMNSSETVEGDTLQAGTPVTVTMTFGRAFRFPFEAQAGQTFSITATSVEPNLVDPLILLIAPDDTPLIFNDDVPDSMDAAISDFEVPTDGVYTLVLSHARGGSEGDVEVLVSAD